MDDVSQIRPVARFRAVEKWECLASAAGEDLAEEVRKYHLPDFSNWKNHDAFDPPTLRFRLHPISA